MLNSTCKCNRILINNLFKFFCNDLVTELCPKWAIWCPWIGTCHRVGGNRSSFLPTFVFRPLTPPYAFPDSFMHLLAAASAKRRSAYGGSYFGYHSRYEPIKVGYPAFLCTIFINFYCQLYYCLYKYECWYCWKNICHAFMANAISVWVIFINNGY